jgi:lipoprotein LprG
MRCRRLALLLVLVLGIAVGCGSSPQTQGPLPGAQDLLAATAETMRGLHSVEFTFRSNGEVPGLNVREVTGVASTRGGQFGWAHGEADVQHNLEREQYEFVIEGDKLYLTDQDGTRTEHDVPAAYSPAALLDPGSGLRSLLQGATGLKTEGREELLDVPTYRVAGTLARDVIGAVVPGIREAVDVKFWVTEARPRRLARVWVQVPPRQPNEGAVMIELGLSAHNAPVSPTPTPRR